MKKTTKKYADKIKAFLLTFWSVFRHLCIYSAILVTVFFSCVYIFKSLNETIALTILEYLKVVIWPFTILLFALAFKNNIAGLIDRLSEWEIPLLGRGKAKAANEAFNQQENVTKKKVLTKSSDDEDVKAIIVAKESELSKLKNNNEQLIDLLTLAQIELDFERIYNIIFASQIDLILKISSFESVELAYVIDHFTKAQQAGYYVLKNWNLSGYLTFLANNNLLEIVQDQNQIVATQKGRAFIYYLSKMNYKKYGI